MGLDIRIIQSTPVACPKCGEIVDHYEVQRIDSYGSAWYGVLENLGYYERGQRADENSWYGKDMILDREQTDRMYRLVKQSDVIEKLTVLQLIASAAYEGDDVVINADW